MIANISLYSLDDPRIDCCMTAFIKVILSMLAKMLMGDSLLFGDLFLENRVCHFKQIAGNVKLYFLGKPLKTKTLSICRLLNLHYKH